MSSTAEQRMQFDQQLADAVSAHYSDPLGFVLMAYDWPINGLDGPDTWQQEILEAIGREVQARKFNGTDAVMPIRVAISSGHGIGKSALVAWLVDWIMSTRPNCRGTVTANTATQLETKTWSAIREWTSRCLTGHWFEINSTIMYRKGKRDSWFCAPATSAEENSEAFAGQHAVSSSSFYVNDEDSAIPDKIHEVEEGGLTDGEPFQILCGNPTRNTGAFHAAAFGAKRDRYLVRVIDSRERRLPNKQQLAEWATDYGEDSDFFRVRVRGLPPNADELQYIDHGRVRQATVNIAQPVAGDPLIMGVDVSGGGAAWTVARFRRGNDARAIKPVRLTGEQTNAHERALLMSTMANAIDVHKPDAVFVDSAFGAVLVQRLRQMGYDQVFEISFGAPSVDEHFANQRAFQWAELKEWLPTGCIDAKDQRLQDDLEGPGFHINKQNKLVLESKQDMQRRGVASPDDGDALSLTFARRIQVQQRNRQTGWLPVTPHWQG